MSYRALRRLLLAICVSGAVACWWFSSAYMLYAHFLTPYVSVNVKMYAYSIAVSEISLDGLWVLDYVLDERMKIQWQDPVGDFKAGQWNGHWAAEVPLWFPWFMVAGCGWFFLRWQEKRAGAAEKKLAEAEAADRFRTVLPEQSSRPWPLAPSP